MLAKLTMSLACCLALTGAASAHHKAGHHIPPGQMKKIYDASVVIPEDVEFVCLVTTAMPGNPYANVIRSQWLPRREAQAVADLGDSFIIYHPDLNSQTGCLDF